ncbi:hypothetical protein VN0824_02560 [Helicobacter pylori]
MLKSFKKAFLGLYAWACWVYCVGGGVNGKSQTLKELVLLGMKNYKEQDFSQAKEYFKK